MKSLYVRPSFRGEWWWNYPRNASYQYCIHGPTFVNPVYTSKIYYIFQNISGDFLFFFSPSKKRISTNIHHHRLDNHLLTWFPSHPPFPSFFPIPFPFPYYSLLFRHLYPLCGKVIIYTHWNLIILQNERFLQDLFPYFSCSEFPPFLNSLYIWNKGGIIISYLRIWS